MAIIPSVGQQIERIILTSQRANEPPTKQGYPKFRIEFKRNKNNQFVAVEMYENKKKIRLQSNSTIESDVIKKVVDWRMIDNKYFTQTDLEFEYTRTIPVVSVRYIAAKRSVVVGKIEVFALGIKVNTVMIAPEDGECFFECVVPIVALGRQGEI